MGSRRSAALLVFTFGFLALAPSSDAASPSAIGWWEEAQQSTSPTLPAPPDVPPGGLFVANGPMGAVGVSALLLPESAPGLLRLRVSDNSTAGALASIDACRALSAWPAEQNGPWRDAPQYDCGNSVAGVFDGSSYTWKLPAGFGRDLGVVIAPHPGMSTPFELGFNAPGSDAFTPNLTSASATAAPSSTIASPTTFPSSTSTTSGGGLFDALRPVLPGPATSATEPTVLGEQATKGEGTEASRAAHVARRARSRPVVLVGAAVVAALGAGVALVAFGPRISARWSSRP